MGTGMFLKATAVSVGLCLATAVCHVQTAAGGELLIRNATVISPERTAPLPNADILIRDGEIVAIAHGISAPSAHQIDASGRYLIPGLIDSHVHVGHSAALDENAISAHPDLWASYRAQVPRAYLAFGFTTVVDFDFGPRDRAWFEGTPLHPRFYTCGPGIKVAGGYGAFNVPERGSPHFPNLVFEPEEGDSWPKNLDAAEFTPEHAIGRIAAAGAVCAKVFVESGFGLFKWPHLRTPTLRRIGEAAHKRNLRLAVHATSLDAWRTAIEARAGIIAHGLWVWPGNLADPVPSNDVRNVIAAASRYRVRVQPTLQVIAGEGAIFDPAIRDDPRMAYALPASVIAYLRSPEAEKARLALVDNYRRASPAPGIDTLLQVSRLRTRATFKLMLEARVSLLFGSDTPSGDGIGNPPGLNGRLEIGEWADAGASPAAILRAATIDNAIALGLSRDLGSIEPGKRADLLLLGADPLKSVSAYDAIEAIFLNGEPIRRETLRPNN